MGQIEESVEWFHKALGLKRDDTFSTTMLNYVIQQLAEDQLPFPGSEIKKFQYPLYLQSVSICRGSSQNSKFFERRS